LAERMRVWNWLGGTRIELSDQPLPQPGPHEVLLRMRAVGICGTDLHMIRGILQSAVPPIALGHEIAGDVVACGSDVAYVKVGDRCAIDPGVGCGYCEWCRTGQKSYCPHAQQFGFQIPGGWQEFLVVPEVNCYTIADHVTYAAACQAEPLFVVVGGIDKLQIKVGEPVLVIGAGPTGLLFASLAQQASCYPVILAGTRARRLDIARQWGIGQVLNVRETPLEQALPGMEFPVVIEAVGTPQAVQQALTFCAPRGRVLLFGVPGEASIGLDVNRIVVRDNALLGTTDTPTCWPRVSNLIAGGKVPLADLVTQTYPFDRLPQAVAWAMEHPDETIKVVVEVEK
jgi:2-desacetyl-2-hydroxyethyl bacteriochlorophyllide A dehydrogenase